MKGILLFIHVNSGSGGENHSKGSKSGKVPAQEHVG
jgi:hypothetical protein